MPHPRLAEALGLDAEGVGHSPVEALPLVLRPDDQRVPQVEDDGAVLHFLRSFFSWGHVRVFSTCSFVSQARRA